MRKPKNLRLCAPDMDNSYEFEVAHRGQKLMYLKPNETTFIWIEAKQIRKLKTWLKNAEKWMSGTESKK